MLFYSPQYMAGGQETAALKCRSIKQNTEKYNADILLGVPVFPKKLIDFSDSSQRLFSQTTEAKIIIVKRMCGRVWLFKVN